MGVYKRACPKCGQKVSGDESFFGSTVACPICSADIYFPYPEGWQGERKDPPPAAGPPAGPPPQQPPPAQPPQAPPASAPEPPPAAAGQAPPPEAAGMDDTQSYQPQPSLPQGYPTESHGLPDHSHTAALDPSKPSVESAYGSPGPPPGAPPAPAPGHTPPAGEAPPAEAWSPPNPTPGGPPPGDHHDESLDVERSSSAPAPPPEPAPDPVSTDSEPSPQSSIPLEKSSSGSKPGPPVLPLTSLITGILGIVTCVGFILLSPAAIITGHMALSRGARARKQPFPGKRLALVGLILGYIGLAGGLIGLALMALGVVGGTAVEAPIEADGSEEIMEFSDPKDPSLE